MLRKAIVFSLACLLVAGLAFPQQSYGRLEGVVTDGQGLVLPGVNITLTGPQGDTFATSDVDGSYRFAQLSPSTYTLQFELSGFQTVIREGVIVSSGSTFSIDQGLELATVAETITVTGESPIVDVKTTGVSATFDKTQLDEVPSATDMWAVLGQSPGIRMRGYDVGGSHKSQQSGYETFGVRSQNRIINEGVNTTEGTGGAGGYYDYYAIEEFQVSAQGADVEMDAPGAQVVATVKSGGNQFSSLINLDIEPAGDEKSPFVTDNIDSELEGRGGSPSPVREFFEFHVDIGGPIIKDKAWFYGAYNYFKIDRVISGQPIEQATDIGLFDMPSVKVNFQLTERDQFIGYSQWSLKQKPYRGLSASIPAESIRAQDSWTWLHKAEWQRVWSDRMFSNILVAHFGFGWPMVPAVDPGTPTAPGRPARIDISSGDQRGSGWQPFTFFRYKPHSTGQFNYYIPDAAGSHDIKFGWDWQIDSRQFGWNTNSGAIRYRDNSGNGPAPSTSQDPGQLGEAYEIQFFNVPTLNDDRNMHTDFYVQDTWTMNDRATVTIGFRFGKQDLYYLGSEQAPLLDDPSFGVSFTGGTFSGADLDSWSYVAPRMGITYDVTGRGQTVFKGYYGRYYGNIGTGLPGANPAGQQGLTYQWNDLNGDGWYSGAEELGEFQSCSGVCGAGGATPISSDLKLMYTDEFSLSLEHELVADTSVRVSYVRKSMRDRWTTSGGVGTMNLARETSKLTAPFVTTCTGCPAGYEGMTLNLRDLPDGAPKSDVSFGNATGDSDSDWNTYQLAFNRRFRNNFFFNASFDYQTRSELTRATGESGSPLSVDPIDRAWAPAFNSAIGQVQDTTNWQMKSSARYEAPANIGIAGTFRHQSGWPWAPIHRMGLPYLGTQAFFLEEIQENRSENVNIVDFRVDKEFALGDRYTFMVMADVFNLLNVNPATNFRLRTGSSFYNVIDWLGGRTLKIGLRLQF